VVTRPDLDRRTAAAFAEGVQRIRVELEVPGDFPDDVIAAARAVEPDLSAHVDRTADAFVTIDPESSTDLDQAFTIDRDGDDVVLNYAIADVGAFVRPGDVIDAEAWRRGVTVYLPGERSPLYPRELANDKASLLPDVDRPAVILVVRIAPDGAVALDAAQRAVVRSRAKLAYGTVGRGDLPEEFAEIASRIEAAEDRRGAGRVEFPEQEIVSTPDGFELQITPRLRSEEQNAALSLAANLAVANVMLAAGTGVFRVMDEVPERSMRRLRHTARGLGLNWPDDEPLETFERSQPSDDPRAAAFLLAVRRSAGGASYARYESGAPPSHSAVKATYAHATAPLRRLQDRYVLDATVALAAGAPVPPEIEAAFEALPAAMAAGQERASRAERAALDLAEAIVLDGREGELFDAVVTDIDQRGARIQLVEPAVVARVDAHHVEPGDDVRVRLVEADPAARSVRFERVS